MSMYQGVTGEHRPVQCVLEEVGKYKGKLKEEEEKCSATHGIRCCIGGEGGRA